MKKAPVNSEAFAQYIQEKSVTRLLHHARKESLKRVVAHKDLFPEPQVRGRSGKGQVF